MKNKYLKRHLKEHVKSHWRIVTIIDGMFFGLVIPMVMFLISDGIDALLPLSQFTAYPYNYIIGFSLMICGTIFWVWSVFSLSKAGMGSSLPLIPTKKLVTIPPYSYCRNPITFGAFLYYLGFGILISSFSFIGLSILLMVLIILYLKIVEETGLKERFGESYIKYKANIPFLIPWLRTIKK